LQHPPSWQAQNTVRERFALLQPHLDKLQGVPLWHPHLMSFRTESVARFTASVIAVGTSDQLTSPFFYLYFSTSNSGGSSYFADRQIVAWWWARFTFSTKASVVGGSEHSVGVDTCSLPVLAAHAVNRAFDIVSHFCLQQSVVNNVACSITAGSGASIWPKSDKEIPLLTTLRTVFFSNAKAARNSVTTRKGVSSKDFWNNILVFFQQSYQYPPQRDLWLEIPLWPKAWGHFRGSSVEARQKHLCHLTPLWCLQGSLSKLSAFVAREQRLLPHE